MAKYKYARSKVTLMLMLILTQCRTYDQHLSSLPNYIAPDTVNSWLLFTNTELKIAPNTQYFMLADQQDQLNIFFKHKFSENLYFSTYNMETGTWQYNNFNAIIGDPSETLQEWMPAFANNKLLIGSYSKGSIDYKLRIHQKLNDSRWINIIEHSMIPSSSMDSVKLKLNLSQNQKQGTFSFLTGSPPINLGTFPFNIDIIGQESALNVVAPTFNNETTKNSYSVVHKDLNSILAIANSPTSELKIFDLQTSGKEYTLPGKYPAQNIKLCKNNKNFDFVWLIRQDSPQNFSIHEINLDSKTITEKASGINGKKAVIKQDNNNEYYIAFINQNDFPTVIKTKDFNQFTTLGANNIIPDPIDNIQLEIINNTPIISFTQQDQIKILIYDRINSLDIQENNITTPQAIIENNKNIVKAGQPFKVNGSMSTGGILTYFWSVEPSNGVSISDVTSSEPYITLPERPEPYRISLIVNNSIQTSTDTSVSIIASTTSFPTKIEEVFTIDVSTVKTTADWLKLQGSRGSVFDIYLAENDLTTFKPVGQMNFSDTVFKITRTNNYDPFDGNTIVYNYNFKIMDSQKNFFEIGTFRFLIPPHLPYDDTKRLAIFTDRKSDTEANKKFFHSSAEKILVNITVSLDDLKNPATYPEWANMDTSSEFHFLAYEKDREINNTSININTSSALFLKNIMFDYNPKNPPKPNFILKLIDRNGKQAISSPIPIRLLENAPSSSSSSSKTAVFTYVFMTPMLCGITWTFQ